MKKGSRRVRAKDEWIPHHIMPILADNGLFEKVQSILDYYSKYQPKNKKYDYLLSGLVWCECGERRVGDPKEMIELPTYMDKYNINPQTIQIGEKC